MSLLYVQKEVLNAAAAISIDSFYFSRTSSSLIIFFFSSVPSVKPINCGSYSSSSTQETPFNSWLSILFFLQIIVHGSDSIILDSIT